MPPERRHVIAPVMSRTTTWLLLFEKTLSGETTMPVTVTVVPGWYGNAGTPLELTKWRSPIGTAEATTAKAGRRSAGRRSDTSIGTACDELFERDARIAVLR